MFEHRRSFSSAPRSRRSEGSVSVEQLAIVATVAIAVVVVFATLGDSVVGALTGGATSGAGSGEGSSATAGGDVRWAASGGGASSDPFGRPSGAPSSTGSADHGLGGEGLGGDELGWDPAASWGRSREARVPLAGGTDDAAEPVAAGLSAGEASGASATGDASDAAGTSASAAGSHAADAAGAATPAGSSDAAEASAASADAAGADGSEAGDASAAEGATGAAPSALVPGEGEDEGGASEHDPGGASGDEPGDEQPSSGTSVPPEPSSGTSVPPRRPLPLIVKYTDCPKGARGIACRAWRGAKEQANRYWEWANGTSFGPWFRKYGPWIPGWPLLGLEALYGKWNEWASQKSIDLENWAREQRENNPLCKTGVPNPLCSALFVASEVVLPFMRGSSNAVDGTLGAFAGIYRVPWDLATGDPETVDIANAIFDDPAGFAYEVGKQTVAAVKEEIVGVWNACVANHDTAQCAEAAGSLAPDLALSLAGGTGVVAKAVKKFVEGTRRASDPDGDRDGGDGDGDGDDDGDPNSGDPDSGDPDSGDPSSDGPDSSRDPGTGLDPEVYDLAGDDLRRDVGALEARGIPVVPSHENSFNGSEIRIDRSASHAAQARALAHEASHARRGRPDPVGVSEVASREEFIERNLERRLADEAEAFFDELEWVDQFERDGGELPPDEFDDLRSIYASYQEHGDRDRALREIAEYLRTHPKYGEKYRKDLEDEWGKAEAEGYPAEPPDPGAGPLWPTMDS
jgi:hypothetical protein